MPHYFKPSIRSLVKNKVFSLINIIGLAIGTSAALVIYLIAQYDLSFDHFEPGKDRIYRIVVKGDNWANSGAPSPLHQNLGALTGIEHIAPLFDWSAGDGNISIPEGNNQAPRVFKKQEKVVLTNADYFALFPHEWIAGNAESALKAPRQVVLTESRARTYFPGIPPGLVVGRAIALNDTLMMTVSGVVKDLKENSDFDSRVFVSVSTIPGTPMENDYSWQNWGSINSADKVIIRLAPGVSATQVQREVNDIFKSHRGKDEKAVCWLQLLSDIHFNQQFDGDVDLSTLRGLILLAVFILLLGAINFINLSTAQASGRAKEIGMHKILGSTKRNLIARFMTETFMLTAIAAILSLVITPFLLMGFSSFLPGGLSQGNIWQPHVFLFLGALIIVVGFLSGFYPALVLTGFNPLVVTKNQPVSATGSTRGTWLRKTLTVSQFVVAQVFVIGTLVVAKQIHFSLAQDMGFRKDAVVNFYVPFDFSHPDGKKFVLLNKLRAMPEVEAASLGNQSPAFSGSMSTDVTFKEGKTARTLDVDSRDGDTSFIGLYHIKLIAGKNVLPTDSATQFLINETLARQLGFKNPADAVGHYLVYGGKDGRSLPITGVMADFHLASMRTAIHPLIFFSDLHYGYVMHVALHPSPENIKTALDKMTSDWKELYPDVDFSYTFLDKEIENFYSQDQKLSSLLSWATGIAILISCMGLLGLVIYTANQRAKEISVRKVLGATVVQLVSLLSRDFVALVGLAFVIAVPVAWYLSHQWLQNFAYHTKLDWWLFGVGGVFMLVVALLILCARAVRAAMANPIRNLRSE